MKHEKLINQLNRQIEYPCPSDNEKSISEYIEAVKDLSRIEQLQASNEELLEALKLAKMCLKEVAPDAYNFGAVGAQIDEAIESATK